MTEQKPTPEQLAEWNKAIDALGENEEERATALSISTRQLYRIRQDGPPVYVTRFLPHQGVIDVARRIWAPVPYRRRQHEQQAA